MKKLLATLALAFALCASGSAQAQNNLSLVGLANITSFKVGSYSTDSTFSAGGGALLEFQSSPGFGLEFGALYAPRTQGSYTANTFQVPVTLRFHLSPAVAFGLGGYYAGYLQNRSYGSSSDYGALASLAFYLPLGGTARFVLDGRYLYGIKDQRFSSWNSRDIQILAGLRFAF